MRQPYQRHGLGDRDLGSHHLDGVHQSLLRRERLLGVAPGPVLPDGVRLDVVVRRHPAPCAEHRGEGHRGEVHPDGVPAASECFQGWVVYPFPGLTRRGYYRGGVAWESPCPDSW